MEKAIPAIDVAAITSGKNGKSQGKQAENGEAKTFSDLLTPARAQAAQPAESEAAARDGNVLPDEQGLPAGLPEEAAVTEAQTVAQLPGLADEVLATDVTAAPSGNPVAAAIPADGQVNKPAELVVPAGKIAADASVPASPEQRIMPDALNPQRAVTAQSEELNLVRDIPRTAQRADPGIAVQGQNTQPEVNNRGNAVSETVLAAVKAGLSASQAAQTAQDGLRQSLTGKRQGQLLTTGLAATTAPVDVPATGFTPLLTEATAISTGRVAVPVGEPGWARAVGEQVVWHVSQNIKSASLRLNPQHLGPMEMQVQMDGDKATLAFASQHVAVRDALESALPRLREMFSQSGLDLVDVNVSQQNSSDSDEGQAAAGEGQSGDEDGSLQSAEQSARTITGLHEASGLVDYYI